MVDVDETFAMSPRGQVIEHQKKLTVFQVHLGEFVIETKLYSTMEMMSSK